MPVWVGGVDDFGVAAGSCDTNPLFEPWAIGESDYRKVPKKTIYSVWKSHRYFKFIADDLVVYVHINFSGPGLNCWLVYEHRFPEVE